MNLLLVTKLSVSMNYCVPITLLNVMTHQKTYHNLPILQ